MTTTLSLRVMATKWEAPNIISFELWPADGGELPGFTAGSHIDLKLNDSMSRSYSLINPQSERHRYVIAVQRDRKSRGGSKWILQNLRAGEFIQASHPRNNFELNEEADESIFIAGGIGITPIMSMISRLNDLKRTWKLVYCARTRTTAPFLDTLQDDPRVTLNFDREPGAQMLDIAAVVGEAPPGSHLYCCGPTPMLETFEEATKGLEPGRAHVEYFASTEPPATEGGFTVVLARSGKKVPVPPGKTILAALNDAGMKLDFSCSQGVCGTCETAVLEGIPDHRDRILTDAERASNKRMMICCSGSRTGELVLDL